MMLDLQKVKIVSVYQKVPKYHAYCYKLDPTLFLRFFLERFSQILPKVLFLIQESVPSPMLHAVAMSLYALLGCDNFPHFPFFFFFLTLIDLRSTSQVFNKISSTWICLMFSYQSETMDFFGAGCFPCGSACKECTCNA